MCKATAQNQVAAEHVLENSYERVSPDDITYSTVLAVINSWDDVKSIPDWNKRTGDLALKKLFELVPDIKTKWGFPADFDPENTRDLQHAKFVNKGLGFMLGLDKAVAYLGPDMEPLEEDLFELGRQHIRMNAEPEHWQPVGTAVIYTLKEVLGDKFTEQTQHAWVTIYNFMAYWMIEGLIAERTGR